jgi:hypothetical protein
MFDGCREGEPYPPSIPLPFNFMVRLPVHPEARAASAAVAQATGDIGTESALSRHQVEILRKCTDDTAIGRSGI